MRVRVRVRVRVRMRVRVSAESCCRCFFLLLSVLSLLLCFPSYEYGVVCFNVYVWLYACALLPSWPSLTAEFFIFSPKSVNSFLEKNKGNTAINHLFVIKAWLLLSHTKKHTNTSDHACTSHHLKHSLKKIALVLNARTHFQCLSLRCWQLVTCFIAPCPKHTPKHAYTRIHIHHTALT